MRLIDVSNYQGKPDWVTVRHQGNVSGAWIKASEGLTFVDPDFAANRAAANKVGIHVGAYHFARPSKNDAVAEAKHFVSVVKKLGRTDLRPVLDYELPTGMPNADVLRWIQSFNSTVKNHLGVWPIFYSYPALIKTLGLKAPVGGGLWLASYSVNDGKLHKPLIPRPWKKIVAQQFTSVGNVPGVRGKVDVDYAAKLLPLLAFPVKNALPYLGRH